MFRSSFVSLMPVDTMILRISVLACLKASATSCRFSVRECTSSSPSVLYISQMIVPTDFWLYGDLAIRHSLCEAGQDREMGPRNARNALGDGIKVHVTTRPDHRI